MIRRLEVSRNGFYEWLKAPTSNTELKHQYLTQEIRRVFNQHNGNYGSPRITQQLYDEGIETNQRVVAVLMQKAGLKAKGYRKRGQKRSKKLQLADIIKKNLVNRKFNDSMIDEIWVTDITYVPCSDGRVYLSTYIDLSTRIPRCYKVDSSMKKEIVIEPLKAFKGSKPKLVHTDQGSQYTSYAYAELLEGLSIQHSMSNRGTPVDNAVIESFHNTIKRELIKPNHHKTKAEMKVLIGHYLMQYYTHERIHTKFMMTPYKYQEKLLSVT
jgi:putative transposase